MEKLTIHEIQKLERRLVKIQEQIDKTYQWLENRKGYDPDDMDASEFDIVSQLDVASASIEEFLEKIYQL